jgi:hypothetical protein
LNVNAVRSFETSGRSSPPRRLHIPDDLNPQHIAHCKGFEGKGRARPSGRAVEFWVCGRSLAEIAGSNPVRGIEVSWACLCCQVEVSAYGWSLVHRSPTGCACVRACVCHWM